MIKHYFFRIIFILVFNGLLYLAIVLNLNFLFLSLNLLILFFIYELYIHKKNYEKFIKSQKLTNEDEFNINYLPASEHPIIKAAKKRLKS
jgi:predicted membrane protein|tara:strand:+ start:566 stop:835 length:270 start_codon:yes stop_codon:yes gene_type:complete